MQSKWAKIATVFLSLQVNVIELGHVLLINDVHLRLGEACFSFVKNLLTLF